MGQFGLPQLGLAPGVGDLVQYHVEGPEADRYPAVAAAKAILGFQELITSVFDAMALDFLYYNFVRIHATLCTTPAMAAGVTKRFWEMSDVVEMLEALKRERRNALNRTRPPTARRPSVHTHDRANKTK
jgi:hypothetical protein